MDNKTGLKAQFEEFLESNGENSKKLEQAISTFTNGVFDMFLNGLELYRNDPTNSYKEVFLFAVIPLMRNKLDIFGIHNFQDETYKRYESLFISFMKFARKNSEYINNLMLDRRKEKLENLVEGQYGKTFDKKSFLNAWHDHITKDTGKNGDKHRKYLADIYGYLSNRQLELLYEIFFNSYEICSKINSKNNEHKGEENYEKRDAFDEAFSNIKSKLYGFDCEKLSEIKSLFGKYLNFIPKYRDIIFNALDGKTGGGKAVQKDTEASLLSDLSENQKDPEENPETVINGNPKESNDSDGIEVQKQRKQDDFGTEGDGFGPIEIVNSSRDSKKGIYDQTKRGDIIAPIDYGIFPDDDMD